jgi:hypothetical protein
MDYLKYVGVVVMVLGLLSTMVSWMMLCESWRGGRLGLILWMIGGIPLAAVMLFIPSTRLFAGIPLCVNYFTLSFLFASPWLAKEFFWKTRRFNLLEEYAAEQGAKKVTVSLFRGGVLVVTDQFGDPVQRMRSGEGRWQWEGNRLLCHLWGDCGVFEAIQGSEPRMLKRVGESPCEDDHPLAGVELKLVYERKANAKAS